MNNSSNTGNLQHYLSFNALITQQNKKLDSNLSIVHGIGITEFTVMHTLSQTAQHTMSRIELANAIGLSASGITRVLNPMEKIGLVEKQKQARDARVSLVKLSTAGERVYQEALTTACQVSDAFYQPLSTQQVQQLNTIISSLK